MAYLNWLAAEDALSPAALTLFAQAIPPNDQDQLLWDQFFPRENVDSVDLKEITSIDYRPTSDRREWNARGRLIPMLAPTRRNISIVPVEARDQIAEKEITRLLERADGNDQKYRDLIGATIPQRIERLVDSNYRRLEVDAISAWTLGLIVQRNPENAAQTYTASFGFSASRYVTAPTAWNDAGVNAYDLLQAWIVAAEDLVGSIKGAMLKLATLNAILADAPNLQNSVKMTRSELADRISQDRGEAFQFFVNEKKFDIFTDGGLATTRTAVWPAEIIAAIPSDERIGRTAFAPVARAQELVSQVGPAGIDVRGNTVYHEASNGYRQLDIEVQMNALPIPDEMRIFVTDVGV